LEADAKIDRETATDAEPANDATTAEEEKSE
jgi:hypothetical protein